MFSYLTGHYQKYPDSNVNTTNQDKDNDPGKSMTYVYIVQNKRYSVNSDFYLGKRNDAISSSYERKLL